MLSVHKPIGRVAARPLAIALACALAAALFAAPAHASAGPLARVAIAVPHTRVVAGSIPFAVRHLGRGVRQVEFKVDGTTRWTAHRAPFRYLRSGRLNTQRLHNGVHVLMIKVMYAHRRIRVAQRRIVVHNRSKPSSRGKPVKAKNFTAPGGPVDAGVVDPPAGGVAGPVVALFNRESFSFVSSLSTAVEANRYQVIVLQYTDAAIVPLLKLANPRLKVLLYSDVTLSRPSDPAGWSTCTSFAGDQSAHPNWFVRDQHGNLIQDRAYAGAYVMDVGNAAYEQSCVAHALGLAQQGHFDGLYLDDITANISWVYPTGVSSPQYPSAGPWQSAMSSMVSYATAQIHAGGLLAVGNVGGAFSTPGLWARWNSQFDGAEEQAWNDPAAPLSQQLSEWPAKLAEAAWSEANGKYLVLGSYDTTQAGNRFGFASMLLVAGGHCSYSVSNANQTSDEAWYPEYTTAQQLGAPAGTLRRLTNGVYERVFANGIVLVNPTAQATPAFSLGGAAFSGSGLTNATSTAMGAKSALVLLRTG